MAGAASPQDAARWHTRTFGFQPVHPPGGEWLWEEGGVVSTTFGTPSRPRQPDYRTGDRAFGVAKGIDSFLVNMQLEDTGLRARLRWKWAGATEARDGER